MNVAVRENPAGGPQEAPDVPTLMGVLDLSATEARCLQALLRVDWAGRGDLPQTSYSIRQAIYTLRNKLRPLAGVYIVNDGRGRYSLSKIGKDIILRKVREATNYQE